MARRALNEKNIRKLAKVGGGKTYSVTLPIEVVRQLGWQEKQKLVIEADFKKEKIIIRDWKK